MDQAGGEAGRLAKLVCAKSGDGGVVESPFGLWDVVGVGEFGKQG